MKLRNIRPLGRHKDKTTGKELNLYIGRRIGRSTDVIFYYAYTERNFISDIDYNNNYTKVIGVSLSKTQESIIRAIYSGKYELVQVPVSTIEFNLRTTGVTRGRDRGVKRSTIEFLEVLGFIERRQVNSVLYVYDLTPAAKDWIKNNAPSNEI